MAGMVGKTVQMKITEVNRARRRVIGSIRAVTSEARKAAQEKIWAEIENGKKYHGVVKSLTSYGAFVDIGGVDGMVHVSELSWNRIKTPADVVKVGDEIDVYVISFDPEKHKISLGYKTAEMNPWNQFMTKYNVGDVVDAKIVKLMTFGAFAEILPGGGRPDPYFPDCGPSDRQARRRSVRGPGSQGQDYGCGRREQAHFSVHPRSAGAAR